MADPILSFDCARARLVLHPHAAGRIPAVLASHDAGRRLGDACARELRHLAQMEARSENSLRRYGWPGGHMVYRSVLRAVLSADGTQDSDRHGVRHTRRVARHWYARV